MYEYYKLVAVLLFGDVFALESISFTDSKRNSLRDFSTS